jgi:hypothetical protein
MDQVRSLTGDSELINMSSRTGQIGSTVSSQWQTSLARTMPFGKTRRYTRHTTGKSVRNTQQNFAVYRRQSLLRGLSLLSRLLFNGASKAFVISCTLGLGGVTLGHLSISVDRTSMDPSLSRPPIADRTAQLTCPVLQTAYPVGMWSGFFVALQAFWMHAEQLALCTSSKISVEEPRSK